MCKWVDPRRYDRPSGDGVERMRGGGASPASMSPATRHSPPLPPPLPGAHRTPGHTPEAPVCEDLEVLVPQLPRPGEGPAPLAVGGSVLRLVLAGARGRVWGVAVEIHAKRKKTPQGVMESRNAGHGRNRRFRRHDEGKGCSPVAWALPAMLA